MKRTTFLAAPLLALALTACGQAATPTTETPRGTNAPTASETTATSEPEPEATAEPAGATTAKFGETFDYEDGVSVTISKPKEFKPSEYIEVDKGATPLSFTVTVVNGSDAPLDLVLFNASLQSSNEEAAQLFDVEKKMEGAPSTSLLPGREAQFLVGFGAKDPADLVLEASPGFEYDAAIWTNTQ